MGVSIPKVKQQVKRKLPSNGDHNIKIKNSIKKKKSVSHNWNVSDV